MAHLAQLWDVERARHIDSYYSAVDDAEKFAKVEWDAAVRLQRWWRQTLSRIRHERLRACVALIQQTYRRWKARKIARDEKVREVNRRDDVAYNGGATKLQALWRGYRSRCDVFDFRERSRYLADRKQDVLAMSRELEDHREKVLATTAAADAEKKKIAYSDRVRREHYMLSTVSQAGVYSTRLDGTLSEVSESDIISAVAPLPPVAERLAMTRRKSDCDTQSLPQLKSPPKKLQGPFLSPDEVRALRDRPIRPTLRMQTPYTHREDAAATAKQREWRERLNDAPFIPVNKHSRSLAHDSLRAGEAFTDAPLLSPTAPPLRQVSFRKVDKISASKDFMSTTRPIPVFDDYSATRTGSPRK